MPFSDAPLSKLKVRGEGNAQSRTGRLWFHGPNELDNYVQLNEDGYPISLVAICDSQTFYMGYRVNFERGNVVFDGSEVKVNPNSQPGFIAKLSSHTGYYRGWCIS